MLEKPTHIQSQYGDMFLIEHPPQGRPNGTWVIALNSGLQCRTGPRRLYVHIARELAKQGYGVIRVDLPGIGDSAGPVPPSHFDLIDPTNVPGVVDYVGQTHAPKALVLMGLCAGARASIRAAKLIPEIDGIVALSMPTFTASPASERAPEEAPFRMSKTRAGMKLSGMKNILLNKRRTDLAFWRRYLNPKFTLKEIVSVVRSISFFVTSASRKAYKSRFISMLVNYTKQSKKIAFLFGERDVIISNEFRELRDAGGLGLNISSENVIMIPDGTHTFSTYSSHKQVVTEIAEWMNSNFPTSQTRE